MAAEKGVSNEKAIFTLEPHLREFFPLFPCNLVKRERLVFRYVPVAVSASDAPPGENRELPNERAVCCSDLR